MQQKFFHNKHFHLSSLVFKPTHYTNLFQEKNAPQFAIMTLINFIQNTSKQLALIFIFFLSLHIQTVLFQVMAVTSFRKNKNAPKIAIVRCTISTQLALTFISFFIFRTVFQLLTPTHSVTSSKNSRPMSLKYRRPFCLQVEQFIPERWVTRLVQRLAMQERHLVGILARCGDTDSSRPIVVEMSQPIGEFLETIHRPLTVVTDNVVVGRGNGALTHGLRHQEKVVPKTRRICTVTMVRENVLKIYLINYSRFGI